MSASTGETTTNQDTETVLRGNLERAELQMTPIDDERLERLIPRIAAFVEARPVEGKAPTEVIARLLDQVPAVPSEEMRIAIATMLGVNPHAPSEARVSSYTDSDVGIKAVGLTQRVTPTPMGPTVVETIQHSAAVKPGTDPRNEQFATSRIDLVWTPGEDPYDVPPMVVY